VPDAGECDACGLESGDGVGLPNRRCLIFSDTRRPVPRRCRCASRFADEAGEAVAGITTIADLSFTLFDVPVASGERSSLGPLPGSPTTSTVSSAGVDDSDFRSAPRRTLSTYSKTPANTLQRVTMTGEESAPPTGCVRHTIQEELLILRS
jgi:hypothetical protein